MIYICRFHENITFPEYCLKFYNLHTLKSLISEYTRLDNSIFFPSSSDIFLHTLLKFWKKFFNTRLLDHSHIVFFDKMHLFRALDGLILGISFVCSVPHCIKTIFSINFALVFLHNWKLFILFAYLTMYLFTVVMIYSSILV